MRRNLLNLQKANKNSFVFYKNILNPEPCKIVQKFSLLTDFHRKSLKWRENLLSRHTFL